MTKDELIKHLSHFFVTNPDQSVYVVASFLVAAVEEHAKKNGADPYIEAVINFESGRKITIHRVEP